jgi:hypothetical protein
VVTLNRASDLGPAAVRRSKNSGGPSQLEKYNRRVADTETFTSIVPDGDFVVTERAAKWVVWRVVGDGASQTTWAFEGGQAPAVAQAIIFARHDQTAAWLRVDKAQYQLIESFRP